MEVKQNMSIIFTDGKTLYHLYSNMGARQLLNDVQVTEQALNEFVELVGGTEQSRKNTLKNAYNDFTILKKVTMKKVPEPNIPIMLKIKDNDGNTAIVKTKDFLTSMKNYCVEFGYETVTEKEIRYNVSKICMDGETEKLDVVGHLVLSHIHKDEYGKYSTVKSAD
jgi:hypothetical protein